MKVEKLLSVGLISSLCNDNFYTAQMQTKQGQKVCLYTNRTLSIKRAFGMLMQKLPLCFLSLSTGQSLRSSRLKAEYKTRLFHLTDSAPPGHQPEFHTLHQSQNGCGGWITEKTKSAHILKLLRKRH